MGMFDDDILENGLCDYYRPDVLKFIRCYCGGVYNNGTHNKYYPLGIKAHNIRIKKGFCGTFAIECSLHAALLNIKDINGRLIISPRDRRFPIVINQCGLDELPPYIIFDESKPLKFIIINSGLERFGWVDQLPKGSEVIMLDGHYIKIWGEVMHDINFAKMTEFKSFVEDHGEFFVI